MCMHAHTHTHARTTNLTTILQYNRFECGTLGSERLHTVHRNGTVGEVNVLQLLTSLTTGRDRDGYRGLIG